MMPSQTNSKWPIEINYLNINGNANRAILTKDDYFSAYGVVFNVAGKTAYMIPWSRVLMISGDRNRIAELAPWTES